MQTTNTSRRIYVGTCPEYDRQFRLTGHRVAITVSQPGTTPIFVTIRRGVVAELFDELLKSGLKPVAATERIGELLNRPRTTRLRPCLDNALARLRRENAPLAPRTHSRLWKATA